MSKIFFAGTASKQLGKEVARLNKYALGNQEVVRFGNSEVKVTIMQEVQEQNCVIMQSTSNPTDQNLMELFFTIDALRREGATKVFCILPYFGYARQDIQHRTGECVSANVIVKILESLGVNKVITVDIHDEATGGIFSIPFTNLSALPFLAKTIYEKLVKHEKNEDEWVIGSPDQGGIERARVFADHFYRKRTDFELIATEKKRNLAGVHESVAVELYGNVKGKKVLLVDDISTSGGTIMHAGELCLRNGAREVSAVVVHPDFGYGTPHQIQQSAIKKLYTTNSIEKTLEDLSQYNKIEIIDIAEIF